MKSLELFSGMGGLALGLQIAGATHEAFVEFNKDACSSLRANYDSGIVHEVDVRHFDFSQLGNFDLVAGGPPCQPFSVGGKHDGNHDDRDMFPFAIKAVATLKPKAFIFENVKGLLRKNFSQYFSYIIKRLEFPSEVIRPHETWSDHLRRLLDITCAPQYKVKFRLLNAANYGVPQVRERVVIVGIRRDFESEWEFPTPTHSMESLDWSMRYSGAYWEKHQISRNESLAILEFLENRNRPANAPYGLIPPDLQPWRTVRDAIGDLPEPDSIPTIPDHKLQWP